VADNQIHQAHKLRDEKDKRKYGQSQERMGENLPANIPVN
jgi:hypothetical protein